MKITVCYPIMVPKGNYCWQYFDPFEVCTNFSNDGGCPTCDLGFGDSFRLKESPDGVLKPAECLNLEEVRK